MWFIGTLLPVIGFAQGGRQAWADRFSYWPHIGLFVAIVWGLAELLKRWRIPVVVSRLAGAVILGWLAMLTWGQVRFWFNTATVWQQAVDVTRDNSDAHEHLTQYYHSQGRHEEAESHLFEALRIQRRRQKSLQP